MVPMQSVLKNIRSLTLIYEMMCFYCILNIGIGVEHVFPDVSHDHKPKYPNFTLECGTELHALPVAYKTWGVLNETRDNVMVICHAFTGSADVEDWCVFIYTFTYTGPTFSH